MCSGRSLSQVWLAVRVFFPFDFSKSCPFQFFARVNEVWTTLGSFCKPILYSSLPQVR